MYHYYFHQIISTTGSSCPYVPVTAILDGVDVYSVPSARFDRPFRFNWPLAALVGKIVATLVPLLVLSAVSTILDCVDERNEYPESRVRFDRPS